MCDDGLHKHWGSFLVITTGVSSEVKLVFIVRSRGDLYNVVDTEHISEELAFLFAIERSLFSFLQWTIYLAKCPWTKPKNK